MADYNSTGYGRDRMSISTSMFTLWDDVGNQLRLSCLDNGLSIAIWVPFFTADGRRQYPVEQRYSTMCGSKSVHVLDQIIQNKLLPAYNAGRNAKGGVFTNSAHSNMIELEVNEGNFFVHFHRGCDAMTHIPQATVSFKFDIYHIITNFDSGTGDINVEPIQADFFVFAKAISGFNELAGGMYAGHGMRMASSYTSMRFMEYLRAIATQVHAQLPAPVTQPTLGMYGKPKTPEEIGDQMPPESAVTEVSAVSDLM